VRRELLLMQFFVWDPADNMFLECADAAGQTLWQATNAISPGSGKTQKSSLFANSLVSSRRMSSAERLLRRLICH
jgi:hypothetical protein